MVKTFVEGQESMLESLDAMVDRHSQEQVNKLFTIWFVISFHVLTDYLFRWQVVAVRDDALRVGSKIGTVGRQCSIRIDCWQPECLAMIFTSRQRFSFKPVTNAQKLWNIFEQIQSKRLWNFTHCILPWGENLSTGWLLGTKLLPWSD